MGITVDVDIARAASRPPICMSKQRAEQFSGSRNTGWLLTNDIKPQSAAPACKSRGKKSANGPVLIRLHFARCRRQNARFAHEKEQKLRARYYVRSGFCRKRARNVEQRLPSQRPVLTCGKAGMLKAVVERAFRPQCFRLAAFFSHSASDSGGPTDYKRWTVMDLSATTGPRQSRTRCPEWRCDGAWGAAVQ